ncbi:MAG TPA: hypothetical protein VJO99_00375 [Burkholderiaceae bacterium]|nr:hypothetical protein [Burkholderiaceae bacterium]
MDREQFNAHYSTLLDDLSAAYAQRPWPSERIDRITERIHAAEMLLARLQHAEPHLDAFPEWPALEPSPQA